jgi:hypothetical protein
MKADHVELMAVMKAGQEYIEAMMETCLEQMKVTDSGANTEEIEFKSEHRVPKEEVAVETI